MEPCTDVRVTESSPRRASTSGDDCPAKTGLLAGADTADEAALCRTAGNRERRLGASEQSNPAKFGAHHAADLVCSR